MRLKAVVAAGLALTASLALAQAPSLAPSPALQCLTPSLAEHRAPAYPARSVERKEGGTLDVELTFFRASRGPRVKRIGDDYIAPELYEAVVDHVSEFRIPCMKTGDPPVVLRQQYVFVPGDGRKVVQRRPEDLAERARAATLQCLRMGSAHYPGFALEDDEEGNFAVRMRFTAADAAPEVTIVAGPPKARKLRRAATNLAEQARLPCLPPGQSIEVDVIYRYQIEGSRRTLLRDMDLLNFLRLAKHVPAAHFDLDAMQCPFAVRIGYRQPFLPSTVAELETSHPARAPLLQWLATIEIDLTTEVALRVLGDEMTVSVPCGKIEL